MTAYQSLSVVQHGSIRLAEKLDVSVRTINNHVDQLIEDDRIAATQIGNATAYYVPFSDMPAHRKPDHTCARCGREVNETHDFAKIETKTYFTDGQQDPSVADFYIFCRFCYADLVSWILDPATVGCYPFAHSWDIPTEQLEEVRNDPDVETAYPIEKATLTDEEQTVYNIIASTNETTTENESKNEDDKPDDRVADPIHQETVIETAVDQDLHRQQAENTLRRLKQRGFLFEPQIHTYLPAK